MKKLFLILCVGLTMSYFSFAQESYVDFTFGNAGTAEINVQDYWNFSGAMELQQDNKILIGGIAIDTSATYQDYFFVCRLLDDGSIDESFGDMGYSLIDLGSEELINEKMNIEILNDGSFLLTGVINNEYFLVMKFDQNGNLVSNFGNSGVAGVTAIPTSYDCWVNDLLIQEDGKIVLIGKSGEVINVIRLNSDGSLDDSFGDNGIFETYFGETESSYDEYPYTGAILENDDIIVAGIYNPDFEAGFLISLNQAGEYNTDFGNNGIKTIEIPNCSMGIYDMEIGTDGKLFFAGHTWDLSPDMPNAIILGKLDTNGDFDTEFNSIGYQIISTGSCQPKSAINVTEDNELVALTQSNLGGQNRALLVKLESNGKLDQSFCNNGLLKIDNTVFYNTYDLRVQPDNKILVNGFSGAGGESFSFVSRFVEYNNLDGIVYRDENFNGIFDNEEYGINNQIIKIEPGPFYLTNLQDGRYYFSAETGDYTVSYIPMENWECTNEAQSYNITINEPNQLIPDLNFGIMPVEEINDLSIDLTGMATRVGFDTKYWLTYKNNGTILQNGTIEFTYDPILTFLASSTTPDLINNNTFSWNYENLMPFEQRIIELSFNVPGIEYLGTDIITNCNICPIVDDQDVSNNSDALSQRITASYDPNDKLVSPLGQGEDGLVLFDTDLTYTVRFQNTGTDTAFNIKIIDTLDSNLEIESFRFIAASHSCNYQITGIPEVGVVITFWFHNIQLPYQSINEINSHGFVKFNISPKPNLAENTQVTNEASIYFDYNPPILTNQVVNTYVSSFVSVPEKEEAYFNIYPNPANDMLSIEYINPNVVCTFNIYSVKGDLVKTVNSNDKLGFMSISLSDLNPGNYIIECPQLQSKQQFVIER